VLRAQQGSYIFLVWNLFLAWVPYGWSLWAATIQRRYPRDWWRLLLPGALWLLFFPNAPYIITDFVHLYQRPPVPLWYDIGLLAAIDRVSISSRVIARSLTTVRTACNRKSLAGKSMSRFALSHRSTSLIPSFVRMPCSVTCWQSARSDEPRAACCDFDNDTRFAIARNATRPRPEKLRSLKPRRITETLEASPAVIVDSDDGKKDEKYASAGNHRPKENDDEGFVPTRYGPRRRFLSGFWRRLIGVRGHGSGPGQKGLIKS